MFPMLFLNAGALALAASAATTSPSVGKVWVVGPGGQFVDIQAAVDAAADGDALVVRPGTYSSFFVDDKALAIVGDDGGTAIVLGEVRVENLAAGKLLVLSRMTVDATVAGQYPLRTRNDAGAIRVQSCTFEGFDSNVGYQNGGGAAWNAFDDDVVFSGCTLNGGDGLSTQFLPSPTHGGGALFARSSNVALFACVLRGGNGGSNGEEGYDGGDGGHGLEIPDGTVHASGSSFVGGNGGHGGEEDGYPPYMGNYAGNGGDGGHGAFLGSVPPGTADPRFEWRASTLLGGALGFGGSGYWGPSGSNGAPGQTVAINNGTNVPLTGPARSFTGSVVRREGQFATLTFRGAPGDDVHLRIEYPPTWIGAGGHDLAHPALRDALHLGQIPASGVLTTTLPMPELGVGVESRVWILRSRFVDTQGVETPGNPFALLVLDQQF
ncbi:MAG: hypothetical protein L6Q99_02720 [Planctomycetes bacterium]|nr:hypothetical protein [Planctomycetota bacterium]